MTVLVICCFNDNKGWRYRNDYFIPHCWGKDGCVNMGYQFTTFSKKKSLHYKPLSNWIIKIHEPKTLSWRSWRNGSSRFWWTLWLVAESTSATVCSQTTSWHGRANQQQKRQLHQRLGTVREVQLLSGEQSWSWGAAARPGETPPISTWLRSGSASSSSFGELLEWILPISSKALAKESRSAVSWWRASHRFRMTAEGLCCLEK